MHPLHVTDWPWPGPGSGPWHWARAGPATRCCGKKGIRGLAHRSILKPVGERMKHSRRNFVRRLPHVLVIRRERPGDVFSDISLELGAGAAGDELHVRFELVLCIYSEESLPGGTSDR